MHQLQASALVAPLIRMADLDLVGEQFAECGVVDVVLQTVVGVDAFLVLRSLDAAHGG